MDNSSRQLRLSLLIIVTLIPIATIGFHLIEGRTWGDSLYFSIITLATIGYGDVVPVTPQGRLFVAILVPFGLSAFAFALQAIYYYLFANPALNEIRQRRKTQRAIRNLDKHYVICGSGELVNKTITYIMQAARKQTYTNPLHYLVALVLDIFDGSPATQGLLNNMVIITQDKLYAEALRDKSILAIVGNPNDEKVLLHSGLERARALLVMTENDTETLLTVLTARNLNRTMLITAAVLDDNLSHKMLQVGANHVMAPYSSAGILLNSATFRPAVSDFFNSLTFDNSQNNSLIQLKIGEGSVWLGKTLESLQLAQQYETNVLGIRLADGSFSYAPESTCVLAQDDILITIGDRKHTATLQTLAEGKGASSTLWQTIPYRESPIVSERLYSLPEAEQLIQSMSKHFIICGSGKVAQRSINALNPERSFVVISDDDNWTKELISRGFRVIHGSSTDEKNLARAGIKRAQAIMVTLEDEAASVLTILNSRSVNKQLLITATAYSDDMVTKLERAGADRVVSPFHVAASFMLLATTAPDISDFIRYVLFNYQAGLETTELYMETDSPWIGRTIGSLNLNAQFKAGIIGIRMAQKTNFVYAPSEQYVIQANEVLIIITPMKYADKLRDLAHGNESKRPTTLRTRVTQSAKWTQEEIMKMIQDR